MDLGEKIRMFRMNAGLTQTKLGQVIDVAPRTISKWESGAVIPSPAEIRKLCKALNIKKTDLIEEEEDKTKKEEEKTKGGLDAGKQSYLKGIACALSAISKVLRVFTYIGLTCLVLCVVFFIPLFFNSFEIHGHEITIKGMKEKIELINSGDSSYNIKIGDNIKPLDVDVDTKYIDNLLDN